MAVFLFPTTICGFFFSPNGSLILTWFPDFNVMERAAGSVWLILAPSKPMADQGEVTGVSYEPESAKPCPIPRTKIRELR